jgi:hypothetical protein
MSHAVTGAGPERLVPGFVELIADRPPGKLPAPATAPGNRPVPQHDDPNGEIEALLAEVVELAGDRAVFPDRWVPIAELAIGHDSVRQALLAEEGSR